MRRAAAGLLLCALGLGAAAGWVAADIRRELNAPMPVTGGERLLVEPGMTLRSVSREMQRRGWIAHAWYLRLERRLARGSGAIQAGEYSVEPGMTPRQLLDRLIAGKVVQHELTLVEGWSFAQILAAVARSPDLVHTLDSAEPARVMQALGHAGYFAEGRFYPDTYHFPLGTTDVDFLDRALEAMQQVLEAEWNRRAAGLPYASPYEALIMASLIEKETAVASERPKIAGVFVRRLERGMRLQTDPTVIYALGTRFDGDIRSADLALDSPYNTYLHAGLPPTPIASPGRAAIRAALQPEPGDALYFVARGDGTHVFSATLEDHDRAVRQYQLAGQRPDRSR